MEAACRTGSMQAPPIARPPIGAELDSPSRSQSTLDLLRRLEQIRQRGEQRRRAWEKPASPPLAARLGGREIVPGLVEVVRRYPLAYRHGRVRLERLAAVSGDRAGGLRWPGPLDPNRLLILDTVTSRQADGATAVLLGVARLADGALELRQWLLTTPAGEPALLDRLAAALGQDRTLVSFNGRRFDAPLLRHRARLQGRDDPLAGRPHLDLLPALRRVHGGQLPDCRLKTVEKHLLGLERRYALPGAFTPDAWRHWTHGGQAVRLNEALDHNRDDLLSTAALLAQLAGEVREERVAA